MNKHPYIFTDLALVNAPFADELCEAACAVIKSGRYLHGFQTEKLEHQIADLCQTQFCVAVSNGLDALRLILRAFIELGQLHVGDEIIVPANTYIASVLAVSDNGLQPVLADIDPKTLNLDTDTLEQHITPRTRAIMPVHLYGTPCCDEYLLKIAQKHNLLIIEDNAQAIGAIASVPGINGTKHTGGLGHAAAISFYPTKNLGALGDGGAVTTNNQKLADTVRALANYGSDFRYHNIYQGLNCRLDEIQAAMLLVKLSHLNEENQQRNRIAKAYDETITNPLITKPAIIAEMYQVWHQYVIQCDRRDELREYLKQNGVMTDIHYATPPHRQPCYSTLRHVTLPQTERLANHAVSLPIAYPISINDASDIAQIINDFS